MKNGSSRAIIVASVIALAAACGNEASRPTGLVLTKQVSSLNDCTPATALAPSGGVQYGDSATLSWALPTNCTTAHRIEVYDTLSGSLVWFIDYPGVYNIGGRNEYHLYFTSPVVKGKYYKWRVRSYLWPDSLTMVGPWSAYATFGIAPSRPVATASIVSGHPRLAWGSANGASSYRIYRQLSSQGSAVLWGTTSSLSYTDNATTVTGSPMGSPPGSGAWAKYYVTSVSAAGIESSYYTAWWFTTTGKGPFT